MQCLCVHSWEGRGGKWRGGVLTQPQASPHPMSEEMRMHCLCIQLGGEGVCVCVPH